MAFASIEEAIADIKAGKFVIVVDDEDRENEGDLIMAAEKVDANAINFMATHARGLICMPMTGQRLDELKIPMMVSENTAHFGTAFTVTVEAKNEVTTGISASDRAITVRVLADPKSKPDDIVRPGHMFPLRAKDGECWFVRAYRGRSRSCPPCGTTTSRGTVRNNERRRDDGTFACS